MKFKMDPKMPDSTILVVRLVYEGQTSDRVWTYVLLKAGGQWYTTGTGKVPQAAGWGAVERWLADGRRVLSIDAVTGSERIYEASNEEGFTLPTVSPFEARAERIAREPGLG